MQAETRAGINLACAQADFITWIDDIVFLSLMIGYFVIRQQKFLGRLSNRPFAKEDHRQDILSVSHHRLNRREFRVACEVRFVCIGIFFLALCALQFPGSLTV